MAFETIMKIASSGMSAETIRLNTIASNLANSKVVTGSEADAYRAKMPVFSEVLADENTSFGWDAGDGAAAVAVTDIIESQAPIHKIYEPNNPSANSEGYVFSSNVNQMQQFADMLSASRNYQTMVDLMNVTKTLQMRTLDLMKTS